MFEFLRKQKSIKSDEQILREQQEEVKKFIAEHEYKMEHDPEYK